MLVLSKSFKTFIESCDNKIARYLNKYLTESLLVKPIYQKLFTSEEINYLTFRNDGTISFLPKGKEHNENEDGTWKRDGRQNGKPSKIIQKIITPYGKQLFNEKDFENFTNCYKVEFNDENLKLELLPNTEVGNVYLTEAIEGEGSLQSSCMRSDDDYNATKDYFEIYENCKDLQILVLKKNDLIAGRALVWKIGDITLMDRVYVGKEYYFEMFFDYAKKNKWWRKYNQSYDTKETFLNEKGEKVYKTFKIETDTEFDKYPYIDTFTYGTDSYLTNSSSECNYTYNCTNGDRENEDEEDNHDDETWDYIDDCYIDEDDASYIDDGRYSGNYTHRNNTIEDVDGNVWWNEDGGIVELNGEWYPKNHNDVTYDDVNDTHILIDESIEITKGSHKGSITLANETIEDVNGDIWSTDDRNNLITEIDEEWYDVDDVVDIDGTYYLKDSKEIELINDTYQLKTEEHAE